MRTITGYRETLVDWNETGKNSKLKLSRGNIKKETVLIAKVKAHYKAAGVPIPKDIVRSVTEALRKIHNAAATKVNNAVASAAR